ncbi:MAG TPA: S-layer homology domain-containing protein [Fervidobacterium sp.]|nr:S-layer homology domain-containing protein [Fervidobacterium sp.]
MKKILVVLTLLSISVLSLGAFRDIPKGHWAEAYVQKLEEIGVVTGFPDGTYRGDEAITRYQIALYIVRTLDYVEGLLNDKQAQIDQLSNRTDLLEEYANQIYDTLGTKADAAAVQQLYDELYAEIEKLQNDVAMQFEDVNLTLDLHDQDIIKLYDLINGINDKFVYTDEEGNQQEIDLAALKNDIDELSMIIDGLAGQLGDVDYALRKQINTLSAKDGELAAKDEELVANIADLSSTIDAMKEQIAYLDDSLVNTYSVLSDAIVSQQEELTTTKDEMAASIASLQEKDAYLEDSLVNTYSVLSDAISSQQEELTTRIDDLETRVLNIEDTVATGLPVMRDMIYGLSDDLKNLEERVTTYTDIRVDDLSQRLDSVEASMVSFKEETTDKIGTLEDRVTLLENQAVTLDQIVADTKADKTDVEDLAAKVDDVEKTAGTKAELEQTRQLATWGVVTGVAGIVIGAIAIIGSLQGWF